MKGLRTFLNVVKITLQHRDLFKQGLFTKTNIITLINMGYILILFGILFLSFDLSIMTTEMFHKYIILPVMIYPLVISSILFLLKDKLFKLKDETNINKLIENLQILLEVNFQNILSISIHITNIIVISTFMYLLPDELPIFLFILMITLNLLPIILMILFAIIINNGLNIIFLSNIDKILRLKESLFNIILLEFEKLYTYVYKFNINNTPLVFLFNKNNIFYYITFSATDNGEFKLDSIIKLMSSSDDEIKEIYNFKLKEEILFQPNNVKKLTDIIEKELCFELNDVFFRSSDELNSTNYYRDIFELYILKHLETISENINHSLIFNNLTVNESKWFKFLYSISKQNGFSFNSNDTLEEYFRLNSYLTVRFDSMYNRLVEISEQNIIEISFDDIKNVTKNALENRDS